MSCIGIVFGTQVLVAVQSPILMYRCMYMHEKTLYTLTHIKSICACTNILTDYCVKDIIICVCVCVVFNSGCRVHIAVKQYYLV